MRAHKKLISAATETKEPSARIDARNEEKCTARYAVLYILYFILYFILSSSTSTRHSLIANCSNSENIGDMRYSIVYLAHKQVTDVKEGNRNFIAKRTLLIIEQFYFGIHPAS